MTTVWTSVVAVLGTLAGTAVTGIARRWQHRAQQVAARHAAIVAAVSDLVSALAEHRRAMWSLEHARLTRADTDKASRTRAAGDRARAPLTTVDMFASRLRARLTGKDTGKVGQAEAVSHQTRAAVTAPLTALVLFAPDLWDAAAAAEKAAYALRNAPDLHARCGRDSEGRVASRA
uniref:hypothetical protein n=1 Tax=Amycolatopsis sp. CA-096443 TaxID=3239919 RepID=UPI003F494BEB